MKKTPLSDTSNYPPTIKIMLKIHIVSKMDDFAIFADVLFWFSRWEKEVKNLEKSINMTRHNQNKGI